MTAPPPGPNSLHRGNAGERRLLFWVLVGLLVVAVLGTIWLLAFREQFRAVFAAERDQGIAMAQQVVRGLGLLVLAQAWAASWWLGRKALAVRRARRYPLPGSRTVLNQRVREGDEAARLAQLGLVVAGLLGLLGPLALWLSWG